MAQGTAQNSGVRLALYGISTLLTGIITLLVFFKVIDAGTAASFTQIVGLIAGLFGTGTTAVATTVLAGQRRDGTLEPTPVEPVNPAITAVQAIQAVGQQFNDLVTGVTAGVQQVQDVAGGLAAALPTLGGIAPGSLAQQVLAAVNDRDAASQAVNSRT